MTEAVVVASALGSAMAAASSSVLQHRSARKAPAVHARAGRLLGHLATRPDWLLGLVFAAVGLGLHTYALAGGRLAIVQPLLVCGVLFALPASVALEGRRPSATQWLWGVALLAGLLVFLLTARPSPGRVSIDADVLAVTTAVGVVVAGAVALIGLRWPHGHQAALLATAAGIGYGLVAALLKQNAALAANGPAAVLGDWPLYVLLAVGAVTLSLTQHAYRAGPLSGSLPALTVSEPAASVAIGALAFHEHLAHSPGAVLLEALAFAVMGLATARLALAD